MIKETSLAFMVYSLYDLHDIYLSITRRISSLKRKKLESEKRLGCSSEGQLQNTTRQVSWHYPVDLFQVYVRKQICSEFWISEQQVSLI